MPSMDSVFVWGILTGLLAWLLCEYDVKFIIKRKEKIK